MKESSKQEYVAVSQVLGLGTEVKAEWGTLLIPHCSGN